MKEDEEGNWSSAASQFIQSDGGLAPYGNVRQTLTGDRDHRGTPHGFKPTSLHVPAVSSREKGGGGTVQCF